MYKNFTLKPEDVAVRAIGSANDHFYLNESRNGYRLSLSPDHTVCLVKKEVCKKEKILVDEEDLTLEQLENARDIFQRANDCFMRIARIRSKLDRSIAEK